MKIKKRLPLKQVFSVILSLGLACFANAQIPDTANTTAPDSFDVTDRNQQRMFPYQRAAQTTWWLSRGNLIIAMTNLQLLPIENEIADLEGLECNALLKRDTAILRKLWTRDFTLDDPLNELVDGKNPLPYYVSYTRMVEKLTVMGDDMVYTSGQEFLQRLRTDGIVEERVTRKYFHAWTRKFGVWKLTTKTHN